MEELARWEGLAQEFLDETCMSTPISAYRLAAACELRVVPWAGSGAMLDEGGGEIRVNTRARLVRRHGLIAHEVGHWVLRRAGEDSDPGARFLSGALLLPRREFDRDLRRTAWGLLKLRELHPNVSAEMIARRIVELRDAVATIIDGRTARRVPSPWLVDPRLRRTSRWERELADRALETGEEVRGDELCYAVPLIDGAYRRVIVVCELEQLSLRL